MQVVRMATERSASFDAFRNFILSLTARMLFESRRGKTIHAVEQHHQNGSDNNQECNPSQESRDEDVGCYDCEGNFLGAFNRFIPVKSKAANRAPKRDAPAQRPRQQPSGDRPPRRCANCSKTHDGPCKELRKELTDRTCWTCGSKLHMNKDCPRKVNLLSKPSRMVHQAPLPEPRSSARSSSSTRT